MIPMITDEVVANGWATPQLLTDFIAISESTPGPIGINMATYIGFQIGSEMGLPFGILGSIIATLGEVTPCITIIIIVSKMLMKFRDSKYVEYTFYGLRAASVGLITAAWLGVLKIAFFNSEAFAQSGNFLMAVDYKSIILSAVIFFLATKFKKIHPIALIVLAAAAGIIFKM
jgi:chromate transporter